jgi:phosphoglycerate dehydrogenase-like enzyme
MKVLFCGDVFPEARQRLLPLLSQAGHELIECAGEKITQHLDDVDVIIPAITRIDSYVLERGRFGLVQQFGVGLESVDIEAATHFGVWVARVPSSKSGNAASVAEHAMFLMLALSRRLGEIHHSLENRRVGEPLGAALLGKTACIVGMGNIGTALALRLRACGMRLLAVENNPERVFPEAGISRVFALSELRQAVAEADYILLCINYHAGLHNLFNATVLSAVKPSAFLINVARGGLINPEALLEALQKGRLAGAGLDVFWEEPVDPKHPLFRQNVIATPHLAGVTDVSYDGTASVCVENIKRYARGEVPLYAVNTPRDPRRGFSPVD